MKIIIAGSRKIHRYSYLLQAVQDSGWKERITEVVSGGAMGVDTLGELYAKRYHLPVKKFLPDWNRYHEKAGFIRNMEMARYAEALIAIWDGHSHGTQHMISCAQKLRLPFYLFLVRPQKPPQELRIWKGL